MDILGGHAKGLKLNAPSGSVTRPTSAKVRSALFNKLAANLQDANFLDLFAGTGAIGLEALSRGAGRVVFIESDQAALKALSQNLQGLKGRLAQQGLSLAPSEVLQEDAVRAVDLKLRAGKPFDIIWSDPPYAASRSWLSELAPKLSVIAHPEAVWLMEYPKRELPRNKDEIAGWIAPWSLTRTNHYGDTVLLEMRLTEK